MGDSSSRQTVGRLLTTIGFVWLALFFVAGSGFIGNTGFTNAVFQLGPLFPFIVLFVGRRLKRSSRRGPMSADTPTPTVPRTPPSVPDRQPPDRRPLESARARKPDPIVVPETSDDDLAEAIGFDDSEASSDQSDSVAEVETSPVQEQPMSSKDMIADARRALDLDQ